MKKIKFIPGQILILMYCAFLISLFSCSDDIIKPGDLVLIPELDTNSLYDWSSEYLDGFWPADLYYADSNNIFITGEPSSLFYDGSKFTEINLPDPNFSPSSINGYDKDNVFIGGTNHSNNYSKAQLIKLKNNIAIEYPPLEDSTGSIDNILVEGANSAWLSVTGKNFIYKFESEIFTRYDLEPKSNEGEFYKDNSGNLCIISKKIGPSGTLYHYYYKLSNNEFILNKIDSSCNNCGTLGFMFKSGNDILMKSNNSISFINDFNWVKICDTRILNPSYNISPQNLAGYSKDYFFNYTLDDHAPRNKALFIWNLNKWSWEKSINEIIYKNPFLYYCAVMKVVDGKAYLLITDLAFTTLFIKGKAKNIY